MLHLVNLLVAVLKKWKALSILFAGLILTVSSAIFTQRGVDARAKTEFGLVCDEIKLEISNRLHAHAQLLRSGSALFAASDSVTRNDWKTFYDHRQLTKNITGIRGLGYSVIIPKNELKRHIQGIINEGFAQYTVRPAGEREIYTSVIYLEPFEQGSSSAFGFDMFSDPVRRRAMELSRDSDFAVLSDKVMLIQEPGKNLQSGILMFTPVYRKTLSVNTIEERRHLIIGWICSPYFMNDLLNGILGRWDSNDYNRIHLRIYDNDSISVNSLLFDSQGNDTLNLKSESSQSLILPLVFNHKKWTLSFSKSGRSLLFFKSKSIYILIGGVTISFLLFGLFLSLVNTKNSAREIAEKLTVQLRESENRYRTLIEWTPQAIAVHRNGVLIYANPAAIKAIGATSSEEIIGKNFLDLVHPDDRKELIEGMRRVAAGGIDDHRVLRRFMRLDGKVIYVELNVTLIEYDGKPAIYVTMQDVTERKLYEAELKSKNEELTKSNAEKDKFFSIIAHDLRSPFNGFLGLTQIMSEELSTLSTDELKKIAESLSSSATNLYRLIENLLHWASMKQGLIPFHPEAINLLQTFIESDSTVMAHAEKKKIEISNIISSELEVFADRNMLQTIIRNLVSNAVKFTPKGGKISISAKVLEDKTVEISIKDSGIGMSSTIADNLFRINERTNRKGTDGEASTGLGLLLCKEFIEKLGGKIWITSEEDKGSIFYFTLKCSKHHNLQL